MASRALWCFVCALALGLGMLAGCKERHGAGQPGADPPRPPMRQGGPGATPIPPELLGAQDPGLATQGPRGPLPEDGPVTPAPEIEGRWEVLRVLVHGKAVPLPKEQQMGLDFQTDGTLVVHGLQRTRPTREEGIWRMREKKLHTRIGRLHEVREVQRSGDMLTLTRMGPLAVVWEMRRKAGEKTATESEQPTRPPSPASR